MKMPWALSRTLEKHPELKMSNSKLHGRLQNKRKDENKVGVVREKAQFGACRKVCQI